MSTFSVVLILSEIGIHKIMMVEDFYRSYPNQVLIELFSNFNFMSISL